MHIPLLLLLLFQSPHQTDPVKIVASTGLVFYKTFVSPSQGDVCNFSPSCSQFARQSIENYGIIWGSLMASDRLLRCNPWAYQSFEEHYPEVRDHKLYDPIENNYILRPHLRAYTSGSSPEY